ncbi:MAG: dihydrofolate reductase [Bacteroidales bacterium]
MKLLLIAALGNNNVIGKENQLMWHMPADLKHFKNLTMGHTLIMGRKTFESMGKPLKGRETIVVTGKKDYDAQGCQVANSISEALKMVKDQKDVFVAGGEEIYRQTIDLYQARRLYITRIYGNFEGDAFFPEIDPNKWELVEMEEHEPDEKHKYPYAFLTYKKKTHSAKG